MTSILETALSCVRRGWFVFPCWPKTKKPMTLHGLKDATNDESKVRAWWGNTPDANIAVACGQSGLAVLDIDHGLADETALTEWAASLPDSDEPPTYAVRTGRRPELGVQLYFAGAVPDVGLWKMNGCEGQVKSLGGYVMAAGSVHPVSGERYEVLADEPVQVTPGWVRALKTGEREALKVVDGKKVPEGAGRHHAMTSIAGSLRAKGLDGPAIYEALIPLNPAMCEVPLYDEDLKAIAYGVAKRYAPNEPEIKVILGGKKAAPGVIEPPKPMDPDAWKAKFHTRAEMENAPPISFLIDGFLQCEGVTAIAAPVRERKTLIAMNVVHSLLTGEKLFGHFEVIKRPSRVLYLVPELSIGPFTDRMKRLDLVKYVGDTLFCRTLSSAEDLKLDDPVLVPALPGAVVFLDTAIRFLEGDENSSQDVGRFAHVIFALLKGGAQSIVMLHHSPKGEGDRLTLESALRGSGDMGAFLAACWGTKLQEPEDPYKSASYLENLKQRDFQSKPFNVTPTPTPDGGESDCKLHYAEEDGVAVLKPRGGFKANKDGKDDAATELLRLNPKLSIRDSVKMLADHKIKRGRDWVSTKRADLLQASGGEMP